MVYTIANQSIKISKKARPGSFNPKKIIDHTIFKATCKLKTKTAFSSFHEPKNSLVDQRFHDFCFLFSAGTLTAQFFDHTRYKETPIKRYKRIQTGAKIQFGGLNEGFSKKAYQLPMAGVVKKEPIKPAASQIKMLIINLAMFFIFGSQQICLRSLLNTLK